MKKVQSLTLINHNVNIEWVAEFNFLGLSQDEHQIQWPQLVQSMATKTTMF